MQLNIVVQRMVSKCLRYYGKIPKMFAWHQRMLVSKHSNEKSNHSKGIDKGGKDQWHQEAKNEAKSFMEKTPINLSLQSGYEKIVEENRIFMSSVIETVTFCGVHDLPLRGKNNNEGVLYDLLRLKIKAGDENLRKHFEEGRRNATYTSPQIQNEIISLCGQVVKEEIINDAKKATAYSLMGDESRDIAGKEQLSIGIRFYDQEKEVVREEFVGFVELDAMDAQTIASAIDSFIVETGLDPLKFKGQGYDGCSTMSGKDNGVQAILRDKYDHALYFHCASHNLHKSSRKRFE